MAWKNVIESARYERSRILPIQAIPNLFKATGTRVERLLVGLLDPHSVAPCEDVEHGRDTCGSRGHGSTVCASPGQSVADLGVVRRPMVGWSDAHQLIDTAVRVLLTGVFSSYADNRELQAREEPAGQLDRSGQNSRCGRNARCVDSTGATSAGTRGAGVSTARWINGFEGMFRQVAEP